MYFTSDWLSEDARTVEKKQPRKNEQKKKTVNYFISTATKTVEKIEWIPQENNNMNKKRRNTQEKEKEEEFELISIVEQTEADRKLFA